jgi:sec-independent protein translocase protein TatA
MFGMGPWEIGILGLIAVVLFGGSLPKVARQLGSVIPQFKRGISDVENEIRDTEKQVKSALED